MSRPGRLLPSSPELPSPCRAASGPTLFALLCHTRSDGCTRVLGRIVTGFRARQGRQGQCFESGQSPIVWRCRLTTRRPRALQVIGGAVAPDHLR